METKEILRTPGGAFLLQETYSENIFTPEDFSEEQQMMRDAVKEFIDREVWPNKYRFEQKDYDFTFELMRKAGELGFLGVSVPEAYGGLEMGFVSAMLVCDYFSGATGSLSTAYGAHTGIGIAPIVLYGTEKQKQKYIPKLASGEEIGCYCLTEPEAGSDANSGKTKAVLSEDETHYKISGQKIWISNAGYASVMIVFARIEDDNNITGFIVPYDPENGITLGEEEHKLGIHASSTRQVFFSETKVPVENMLSDRGNGFKIAMNALNVGRVKLAFGCIDAQRRTISESVRYANDRIQFKTPISQFGAIKQKIAIMATNCYVGESGCYRAAKDIEDSIASRAESGESHQEAELKGVEEYVIECSILKVALSEHIQDCTDEGVQIFGGMGYSAEMPMESAWRDARISRIYEGTNEINRMLTVAMLVKKTMKGQLDLISPATAVGEELLGVPSFDIPDYTEPLSEEKSILKNLKKVFLMISGTIVQNYGTDLDKHQQLLLSVSDILIEIYLVESAILRTEKNINRYGLENQNIQLAMTKLYLFKSVEKIQSKGKEAIISSSKGDEQKILLMGLKRFTKYVNHPNVIDLREQVADKVISENQYCF